LNPVKVMDGFVSYSSLLLILTSAKIMLPIWGGGGGFRRAATGTNSEPDFNVTSHLCRSLLSGLLPSGLPTNILFSFFISPMHTTCPVHLMLMICSMKVINYEFPHASFPVLLLPSPEQTPCSRVLIDKLLVTQYRTVLRFLNFIRRLSMHLYPQCFIQN